jgi:hypothetical protein
MNTSIDMCDASLGKYRKAAAPAPAPTPARFPVEVAAAVPPTAKGDGLSLKESKRLTCGMSLSLAPIRRSVSVLMLLVNKT